VGVEVAGAFVGAVVVLVVTTGLVEAAAVVTAVLVAIAAVLDAVIVGVAEALVTTSAVEVEATGSEGVVVLSAEETAEDVAST
jgi:hypothetical protein